MGTKRFSKAEAQMHHARARVSCWAGEMRQLQGQQHRNGDGDEDGDGDGESRAWLEDGWDVHVRLQLDGARSACAHVVALRYVGLRCDAMCIRDVCQLLRFRSFRRHLPPIATSVRCHERGTNSDQQGTAQGTEQCGDMAHARNGGVVSMHFGMCVVCASSCWSYSDLCCYVSARHVFPMFDVTCPPAMLSVPCRLVDGSRSWSCVRSDG